MNKNYPLTKSEQGLYISSLNSGDDGPLTEDFVRGDSFYLHQTI